MRTAVRHVSPYSGSWYPNDAGELRELIDGLFAGSERRIGCWTAPRAAGFVVPHAGLAYSGTVASAVYRQIRALAPERVIVLGFSHGGAARGAWIADLDSIVTPLGEVAIDRECAAALVATERSRGWAKSNSATTPSRFNCRFCRRPRPAPASCPST